MKEITINPKYTKTYKTKETLYKALEKLNAPETLSYLLCEVEGRFTAVFTNSLVAENGVWMNYLVHEGFKVVG